MPQPQLTAHLDEMLEHVETWVERLDRIHARWMFRFLSSSEQRTLAYTVHSLPHSSDSVERLHLYVVDVPTAFARGWPLTNLDDTIRDRTVCISDAVFMKRFVEMYHELAMNALQTLVMQSSESQQG